MTTQSYKRKLTAILSADVKGYSLLMRDDEEATVRTITAYREVIGAIVRKHRGEVVDSPADNILSEFASVVDAFFFDYLDGKIGLLTTSLVSFIGWPSSAIWVFFIIRDLHP
jgi:hypothetical protein